MPTYDYECKHCKYRFETFQSIVEEPLGSCPRCGKSVRRLISGGMGIIFKGSGFYTTDYKNSSAASGGNGSSGSKETKSDVETQKASAGAKVSKENKTPEGTKSDIKS